MLKKIIIISFTLFFTTQTTVNAVEYIKDYDVYIKIEKSGILQVNETITVNAEGNEIKRGIYRDFPTRYKAPLSIQRFHLASESELSEAKCAVANGNKQLTTNTWNSILCKAKAYKANGYNKNTTFEVQNVTKNGVNEPYFVKNKSNGKRLYIGDENVYLDPGIYTYQINYKTNYQIGYFNDHDELYYNAVGTGWVFTIQNASVFVELPASVKGESLLIDGFTGIVGAKKKDFTVKNLDTAIAHDENTNTVIGYKLTKPLNPNEGFTVVVGFNKGIVVQPTKIENIARFILQNLLFIVSSAITLFGTIFVITYYTYMWKKYGKDPKTKGIVRNYDIPKGVSPAGARYIVKLNFDTKALTANIISMATKGFLSIQEDKKRFSKAKFSLKKLKNADTKNLYNDEEKVFTKLFDLGDKFTFNKKQHTQTKQVIDLLKKSLEASYNNKYVVLNRNKVTLPFVVSIITAIFSIFVAGPFVIFILSAVNIFFYTYLSARTLEGRQLYDQLMGLKIYLSAVENPRYESDLHKEIPFSMGVYEKYLPYAIALDVEPQWSTRLKKYLESLKQEGSKTLPAWYITNSSFDLDNFASNLSNNLNSTISSSSTPPGSSSGYGGGSSGGGGGGGGGGGW